MDIWSVLFLSIAISIDSFIVGTTYGIKNIKTGFVSLMIIGSISALAIFLSGSIGSGLAGNIGEFYARKLGSLLLIGIGCWYVYSAYREKKEIKEIDREKILLSLKIRPLGIIIKILKHPGKADLDSSGTINKIEALILGSALSMDALGVGLGAGLTGSPGFMVPLIIGITSIIFVGSGFIMGNKLGNILPDNFDLYPGFVIILLGISKLF